MEKFTVYAVLDSIEHVEAEPLHPSQGLLISGVGVIDERRVALTHAANLISAFLEESCAMPGNGMRADHPRNADSVVVPNASEDHDRFSAANQNKRLFALLHGVAQFLLYISATNSLELKSICLADIGHDVSNNLLVDSPKLSPRPGHSEELPRS
ncbi:TPA: hypothetical protein ACRMYN_003724 [Pseudomonas aeruginosa]|uniref:hypothetical protein n=1 Tax=Pseudomonas aeruginosa TaxID=287 RepID=UPI0013019075|nr:hypothetical protein [Pseudomonas aeruginosa]MBG5850443.1 hypothetical protein [Pseudomonas aeruginosa]MBV5578159.1 hypothetical protein [Pseudomonas aeruginosa]HEK0194468.1 hypothetical protein [Pseudomonas aeruginosa]